MHINIACLLFTHPCNSMEIYIHTHINCLSILHANAPMHMFKYIYIYAYMVHIQIYMYIHSHVSQRFLSSPLKDWKLLLVGPTLHDGCSKRFAMGTGCQTYNPQMLKHGHMLD